MSVFPKIFIREILKLRNRPSSWVLLLIIPLGIFFYLGAIYKQGSIEKVQIAVQDNDHSDLSRKIIRNIEASPKLEIIKLLSSEDVIEEVFNKNPKVKGFYVIPRNFQKNIFLGNQEKLIVYTNSANIIYGNTLYREAATFINIISAGINLNTFKINGIPHEKAVKMIMPIKVISRPLFNSYYNYLYYLVPGLTTVLLQMIVFFLAARSINSEYTKETMGELLELTGGSIFKILFGKLMTYTILGLLVAMAIFAVVHPMLGIPMSKNTIPFLGIVFIFIMTNAMLGLMISAIFKDENMAMDVSFVYNSPAFVFSGFTFPILAMPSFDKWYSQIIPYTHFLKAFTKGLEMNTPMSFLNEHVISLLLFFIFGYVVAVVVLFFRFKKLKV